MPPHTIKASLVPWTKARMKSSQSHRRQPLLYRWVRGLSALLFIGALVGVVALWVADVSHHLLPGPGHQKMAAVPLMLIGASFVALQWSARGQPVKRLKGVMLGMAFVLWGGEQLLPPSSLVTVMDALVITIFVVDLSFIIETHLKHRDHGML